MDECTGRQMKQTVPVSCRGIYEDLDPEPEHDVLERREMKNVDTVLKNISLIQ